MISKGQANRLLHSALLSRPGGSWFITAGRRLILGRALCLHMFGYKLSIRRGAALDERLGLVHKGVGQRLTANVADGESLALFFQNEVGAASSTANAARRNRASKTHAVVAGRTFQRLIFSDGVVVRLALAITKPGEKGKGDDDDRDADAEFRTIRHKNPLYAVRTD